MVYTYFTETPRSNIIFPSSGSLQTCVGILTLLKSFILLVSAFASWVHDVHKLTAYILKGYQLKMMQLDIYKLTAYILNGYNWKWYSSQMHPVVAPIDWKGVNMHTAWLWFGEENQWRYMATQPFSHVSSLELDETWLCLKLRNLQLIISFHHIKWSIQNTIL